ncbi:MAG: hypothetical protein C0421_15570 [Hyphomonas sp.]|uniref:pilus assembly protein TadG-related protein n=1 Tax=Hyphomonas sp. TaxID=87 RepID=UPI0025C3628B|nr:pilus assembly protein TadG-related protein [Hyphomonas sp.]MBA4340248.1 hypothetical protein [Hyphomonas sp.]
MRTFPNLAREQQGAIAPIFAVLLPVLLMFAALAVDVGRAYALRTELEIAVDAAALAAASQLDGQPGAGGRAIAAANGALTENSVRLAAQAENNIAVRQQDLCFMIAAGGPCLDANDQRVRAVKVTLQPRTLNLSFGVFANLQSLSVDASATASIGTFVQPPPPPTIPLAVCREALPSGFDPAVNVGRSLLLRRRGTNGTATGNYVLIRPASSWTDAQALDALGRVSVNLGPTSAPVVGNATSTVLAQWLNVRFDIFRGATSALSTNSAFAPSLNTMIGALATRSSASSQCTTIPSGSGSSGRPVGCGGSKWNWMGLPCDDNLTSSASGLGSGTWKSNDYFNQVHGDESASNWSAYGPARSTGSGPTRFQVYNWELEQLRGWYTSTANKDNFHNIAPHRRAYEDGPRTTSFFDRKSNQWEPDDTFKGDRLMVSVNANMSLKTPANDGDWPLPVCNRTGLSQPAPARDRRVVRVMLADCGTAAAGAAISPVGSIELFLTNPVVESSGLAYAEILGAGVPGGGLVSKSLVRLNE